MRTIACYNWVKHITTCVFSFTSGTKLYCKSHSCYIIGSYTGWSWPLLCIQCRCKFPRPWHNLLPWNIPLRLSGSSFPCHPSPSCPSCSSSSCNSISWWCRSSMLEWVKQRPRQWQWWPTMALGRIYRPMHRWNVHTKGEKKQILWHLTNWSFSLLHVMSWAKYI